jgi:glycerol-3-phosphate acyltransferase PlsY
MPEPLQLMMVAAGLAALCAVLGHMFTPWLGFKGGKGVATAVGAFAALAPRAALVALVLFLIVVAVTRYVSLGSILGAVVFPFAAWWLNPFTRIPLVMLFIGACSLLVILRHKDNIRRLLAGNENRFGAQGKPA